MSMLRVCSTVRPSSPDNYELPLRGKLVNPRPIIPRALSTSLDFRQIAYQRQIAIGFNSIRASDSWRRCRKRNYTMSIKRLFDAVERSGDIGRRVAALVPPNIEPTEGDIQLRGQDRLA